MAIKTIRISTLNCRGTSVIWLDINVGQFDFLAWSFRTTLQLDSIITARRSRKVDPTDVLDRKVGRIQATVWRW